MKKQLLSLLLVLALIIAAVPVVFAEDAAMDPFEEITAEYVQAVKVEPYPVVVRPARITGWAVLRWAPSHSAPLMATYSAKQELTVRKETPNWLLVENTQTGDEGYISRKDVTETGDIPMAGIVNPTIMENGKTELGVIDINGAFSLQCAMPEGYSIRLDKSASDQMVAVIASEDPDRPIMQLSVGYDEAYADVDRLNDLDNEALDVLEKTFVDTDPAVEISYGDTGLGTRLMIARLNDGAYDYLDFMSIYKGYFVECVLLPSESAADKILTDEQTRMCIDFLTEMDFVPAEIPMAGAAMPIANGRYIARLTDYNAENNTVQAEVMQEILLDREEVDNLQAGDTLAIGDETITVDTLEKDEDGVLVNNETYLSYAGGTDVYAFFYEHAYMETIATLTLAVPDNLVFLDYIDPATGEMLDEATEHTGAEFAAMMTEEETVDFASDNVYVSFDENGEMTTVERFYTPWQ